MDAVVRGRGPDGARRVVATGTDAHLLSNLDDKGVRNAVVAEDGTVCVAGVPEGEILVVRPVKRD